MMLKAIFNKGIIPLVLIAAILFASCKIPDISSFTEASAQMTTAIRLGVSETDSIIETASQRTDLFGDQTKTLKESLKNYREATAPTMKTLKGLDAYLEALNSLATAQAKSAENAEAAVNSVAGLAAELNVLKIPETGIKLGTGLVALAEVLRTERDFRKRVLLADRILNGGSPNGAVPCAENTFELIEEKTRDHIDKLGNSETAKKREAIQAKLKKKLADLDSVIKKATDEKTNIEKGLENANELERLALERRKDEKSAEIAKLSGEKEVAETDAEVEVTDLYNNAFASLSNDERTVLEQTVGSNTCGVIDLLKINVKYLRRIYNSVAINLYRKTSNKNVVLISYHDNIVLNDTRVQRELRDILKYKQGLFELSQLQNAKSLNVSPPNVDDQMKLTVNEINSGLNSVYVANRYLQKQIADMCKKDATCTAEGDDATQAAHQQIITPAIDAREIELLDKNRRYTDDLERIKPAYTEVMTELETIRKKHEQMLKVFDASLEALDTWGNTHANLRDSVTAKKPFSAARLFSDVRFILEILGLNKSAS